MNKKINFRVIMSVLIVNTFTSTRHTNFIFNKGRIILRKHNRNK